MVLAILFALVSGVGPSRPQRAPPPLLNPQSFCSPSGEYVLFVDPTNRVGAGPGVHRLTRRGAEVWASELPFTLWEAVVSDEGQVGGYAYTRGRDGSRPGAFHVVGLSSRGELVLDEVHRREDSTFSHTPPDPLANGIFAEPGSDRFVVRVRDPDLRWEIEQWWEYSLSTPQRLSVVSPDYQLEPAGGLRSRRVEGVRALAGVPLRIVWWWRTSIDDPELTWRRDGATFALVDEQGAEVWSLDLLDDYTVRDDEAADDALEQHVRALGALLEVGPHGRFSVWRVQRGVRVDLQARAGEEAGTWTVEPLGEGPWDPTWPPPKPDPPPPIELRRIASVALGSGESGEGLGPIDGFAFDTAGRFRIRAWDGERERTTLSLVDRAGVVERSVVVEVADLKERSVGWWPLTDGRWLLTASEYGADGHCFVAFVDERTGERSELPGDWRVSFDSVSGLPDGGFVALVTRHRKDSSSPLLVAVDRGGHELWRVEEDSSDPRKLASPAAVASRPDGRVAVVDVIRETIQVYNEDGGYHRTQALAEILPEPPTYPSDLFTDPSGALLLIDAQGKNRLVRLARDGTVLATLSVTPPEGRPLDDLAYRVRAAPDGSLWTTEGHALLRLDDTGNVAEVVGELPRLDALHGPGPACIDRRGRILIQDARTAALHAFDASGKKLFVTLPVAGDFAAITAGNRIAVDSADTIHVQVGSWSSRQTVDFTATGERIEGRRKRGWRDPSARDAFADDGSRWVDRAGRYLQRMVGGKVVGEVRRTGGNRWFGRIEAFAALPGGGLAVLHDAAFLAFQEPADVGLSLYAPDGTPLAEFAGVQGLGLVASPTWLAVWGVPSEVLLVRRSDASLHAFTPIEGGRAFHCGFSPDGSELWVLEREGPTLHRFALPE